MKNLVHDIAKEQWQDTQARLLVLHPNYIGQRYMLTNIIESPRSIYLRFDGDSLSADEVHSQLKQELGGMPLTEVDTLVLDECDRVDSHVLDAFLQSLMDEFLTRERTRIVMFTRRVPSFITEHSIYRDRTSMLPVDQDIMLCDYLNFDSDGEDDEAKALLEVHGFGQGRVLLNGVEVNQWDGVLPRSLFFYLVDRGMTTRNDIFDIFWPKLTVKEATNVFHVTKRKINEILGVDLTIYLSGFYRISPEIHLNYDAMQFSRMVQESTVAADEVGRKQLMRAISLYRGEFLTSLNMDWVQNRRNGLLQTYGEALVSLARISKDSGESKRALGLYLRSALTNPQREDLVEHIMVLYDELGMYDDALLVYDRLVHELHETLDDVNPSPRLQALATSLQEKMVASK